MQIYLSENVVSKINFADRIFIDLNILTRLLRCRIDFQFPIVSTRTNGRL